MSKKTNKNITNTITIVVADKSPLVRDGLRNLLGNDERFNLLEIVANGEDFIEVVENTQFHIGIIGWDMPGKSGREILQLMREYENPPRIIIYTGNSAPAIPRLAMQLGCAGFCSKSEELINLLDTAIAVAENRMVFPFMDMLSVGMDPMGSLTSREHELLESLSRGSTNSQIAKDLDISLNTVKFHLKNLYCKLSVKSRSQAVSYYFKSPGSAKTMEQ